jgi:hypothetical protein
MGRIVAPDPVTLRARASGWARFVLSKNRYPSVSAMAKDMGYNQGSLNAIINGKGTVGLDFVIKLALAGQESLDTICLRDPPAAHMQNADGRALAQPHVHEHQVAYQVKEKRKPVRLPKDLS